MKRRMRHHSRGMTLIEVIIGMTILAFIAMAMYSAMDGLRRSKLGVERVTDRYREGRLAMARITRELQSAYLSEHKPLDESLWLKKTIFKGDPGTPAARLDFTSFAHRRLQEGRRESDQMEVTYFGSEDPDNKGIVDLARRENPQLDENPDQGGRVDVLASNIDLFFLEYLDPLTGMWREEWDSTSVVEEKGRLPRAVKIVLVLNDGERATSDSGRGKVRLVTKVRLPMQDPLTFALK